MVATKDMVTEAIYLPTTTHNKIIEMEPKPEQRQTSNFTLYSAAVIVNLMAFATGNAYAWSSSVLIALKSNNTQINPLDHPVTAFEESWIISLLSLGACIGPFLSAYSSDKIGRKKTLLIFALPLLVSHIIIALANSARLFYLGRFMMGLGAGSTSAIIPIYVGEISTTEVRGFVGCFLSVFSSIGILSLYAIGSYVSITSLSVILMVPIVLFYILCIFFVPETPYFYIAKGKKKEAEISLSKIRRNHSCSVLKELTNITEVVEESKNNNVSLGSVLKSRSFRKGITITTTVIFFQQFVGISILLAYMEPIFAATGSSLSPSTSAIIVALIQTITVIITSSLVDKWGRRMLLMISSAGCALPLGTIGAFFYMINNGHDVSYLWWLPVCSLMLYMVAYNFGLGALPWVLVGELFSNRTKAVASSLSAFVCLFSAFLITFLFPTLELRIGLHGSFWFFAANAILSLFFVIWYVPETKGKSFQDILRILEK